MQRILKYIATSDWAMLQTFLILKLIFLDTDFFP